MPDEEFPSRIGVGDGPGLPCRVAAMDMAFAPRGDGSLISGFREADGTFCLDRVTLPHGAASSEPPASWSAPIRLEWTVTPEQASAWVESLTPLFAAYRAQMEAFTARMATVLQPLADAMREMAASGNGIDAAPGDGLDDLIPTEPLALADYDWHAPARNATCAHVCGPDPGHACDARATTSLTHALPSGGVRNLPLCGPCHEAESRCLVQLDTPLPVITGTGESSTQSE